MLVLLPVACSPVKIVAVKLQSERKCMTPDGMKGRAWQFVGSRVRRSFAPARLPPSWPIVRPARASPECACCFILAEACLPCGQVLLSLLRYYLASGNP